MKRILRGLGMVLMAFNGLAVVVMLANAPKLIANMERTPLQNAGIVAAMMAVYGALFYLGYRLYNRGEGGKARSKAAPVEEATAVGKAGGSAAAQPNVAAQPPKGLKDRAREPSIRIYSDPDAGRSSKAQLVQLSAYVRQGMPFVSIACAWRGGATHADSAGDTKAIPPEQQAELSPASLRKWIESSFSPGYTECIDWSLFDGNRPLEDWCRQVREAHALALPEALYPVGCPYEDELKAVGPDGIMDHSGIWPWLRLKDGADIVAAIESLERWLAEHEGDKERIASFILIEDAGILDGLPMESLSARCRADKIRVATLEDDYLCDYMSGVDYGLFTREWAGSADDAATYADWALGPVRPHPGREPEKRQAPADGAGKARPNAAEAEKKQTANADQAKEKPPANASEAKEKQTANAGEAKEEPPELLDDVTYIRAMRSIPCGHWHQYDVLLDARPYGWETMVDWAAYMDGADLHNIGTVSVSDLGTQDTELIDSYRENGSDLKRMPELRVERGMLGIGGVSATLKDMVKIVWLNQTNALRLFTMGDQESRIRPYVETVVRRTFGTPDAMKCGKPLPEKKA